MEAARWVKPGFCLMCITFVIEPSDRCLRKEHLYMSRTQEIYFMYYLFLALCDVVLSELKFWLYVELFWMDFSSNILNLLLLFSLKLSIWLALCSVADLWLNHTT